VSGPDEPLGAESASEAAAESRRRPLEVTVLGWIGVAGGLAQAAYVLPPVFGIGALGTTVTFQSAQGGTLFGIVVSLALAAAALVVFGVMALRGSRHAWRIGIIGMAYNIVWNAMALLTAGMVPAAIGLVASIGLLVYAGTKPARLSFGVEGDLNEALWYRR
jgi:hypothetical protein